MSTKPSSSGWFARPALHVEARFHGRTIEETYARTGRALELGRTGAMSLPVPDDEPYLATLRWRDTSVVDVTDGRGNSYRLVPGTPLVLTVGEVVVELSIVRQFYMPRMDALPWGLSIGWFAVLMIATTGVQSASAANDVGELYRCAFLAKASGWNHVFAEEFEENCVPKQPPGGGMSGFTAEYIARLLREDYAGAERGTVRPTVGDEAIGSDDYFLPAGDKGTSEEMGGAENVAPEPIRSYGTGSEAAPRNEEVVIPPVEEGVVPESADAIAAADDGAGLEDADKDGENGSPAAEEKRGWGVRDWYDVQDENQDRREISEMLKYSHERLRIDPNDTGALSVLSYYQYLGQDYEDALATYDKIIALEPEESAGYNNKALVYKRQGDYATEEILYRMALALEPDDTTALNNLAVNLAHQHRFDEAQAIMNRLSVIDPADPYADLHRAKIQAEQGDDDRAREYLEKALSGMETLDTLHHIEFRQDIRIDPSFARLRGDPQFNAILTKYYGKDTPLQE